MKREQRTDEKLQELQRRQPSGGYGKCYQAAQTATIGEAPNVSSAVILYSTKLEREVHLLSKPEFKAALIALYNDRLFDLQEQRLLSIDADLHPLQKHPKNQCQDLPYLIGTFAVAEAMGKINEHYTYLVQIEEDKWNKRKRFWPYIGDLLLYLEDEAGPYCVNWSVKNTKVAFHRKGGLSSRPRPKNYKEPELKFRYDIEEAHYQSAGIRTKKITGDMFDREVCANLRELFQWQVQDLQVEDEKREVIEHELNQVVGSDEVAFAALKRIGRMHEVDPKRVVEQILKKAIWERRIRVDLFSPLLMDGPLKKETRDVLVEYSELFER